MITCFILYVHTTHNTVTQKYAVLYKNCNMENGEKCVGVSQDCFDCPPTAGYVILFSMLDLHIPYIF